MCLLLPDANGIRLNDKLLSSALTFRKLKLQIVFHLKNENYSAAGRHWNTNESVNLAHGNTSPALLQRPSELALVSQLTIQVLDTIEMYVQRL